MQGNTKRNEHPRCSCTQCMPQADKKKIELVQARLRGAKVFKFDEDAALYAAQMMRDYPEAIAHDIEYAIPPFKQMYIEFPFQGFYNTLTPPEYRGRLPVEDQDVDVGYFYDGPNVYVMADGPFVIHCEGEVTTEELEQYLRSSPEVLQQLKRKGRV